MTGRPAASGPSARFFCKTGRLAGTAHRIDTEATIGRGRDNDVAVPDAVVSKRHARIAFDPEAGTYVLEDLGSRNGTRLDGLAVTGPAPLGSLHVVTLGGQHDFLFVALPVAGRRGGDSVDAENVPPSDAATALAALSSLHAPRLTDAVDRAPAGPNAAETVRESPSLPRAPVLTDSPATRVVPAAPTVPSDAASATGGFVALDIALPGGACRRVELPDGRYVVGRSPACDLPIDDRALSREHAAFVVQAGVVRVEDLNSRNGTFVGDEPVRAPTSVAVGQRVTLGGRITVDLVDTRGKKRGE